MIIKTVYKPRPIRFVELYQHHDWQIKIYGISVHSEFVKQKTVEHVKPYLTEWLQKSTAYSLDTYKIATLILHEGKRECYAIISWWTDENMLQLFAYRAPNEDLSAFKLYSDNGIITCVWEMAVLWFERNAWIENILMKSCDPDINRYLKAQFNAGV